MQWRDDTTLPSRGQRLRPIGKPSRLVATAAEVLTADLNCSKLEPEVRFHQRSSGPSPLRAWTQAARVVCRLLWRQPLCSRLSPAQWQNLAANISARSKCPNRERA